MVSKYPESEEMRETCGYLIKGDPERPCAQPKGHKDRQHRDADQRERRVAQRRKRYEIQGEEIRAYNRLYQATHREVLLEKKQVYRSSFRVSSYVYAIMSISEGTLKEGVSTTLNQITETKSSAKKFGLDFSDAELIWSQEGDENLERFIQAYSGCRWKPRLVGGRRASEWFWVPDDNAESIRQNLKEWFILYEKECERGWRSNLF
jgi:hypothetical protein